MNCEWCKLEKVLKCKLCADWATEWFKRKVVHIVENREKKGDIITYIDKDWVSWINPITESKTFIKLL